MAQALGGVKNIFSMGKSTWLGEVTGVCHNFPYSLKPNNLVIYMAASHFYPLFPATLVGESKTRGLNILSGGPVVSASLPQPI